MYTQNIGNIDPLMQQGSSQSSSASSSSADQSSDEVDQSFLKYMQESPGQRMIDAWLKAHHLTEDDLKKMTPEKRDQIEKEMADDIKKETEQKAAAQTASSSVSFTAGSAATSAVQPVALSSTMMNVFFGAAQPSDSPAILGQTTDKNDLEELGLG